MVASQATGVTRQAPAQLVDTHAHLQWPSLAPNLAGALERAHEAGVGRILTLGTELRSSCAAVALAESHPAVYAAVGIHPGDVTGDSGAVLEQIAERAAHPRVVAIGETGLDYYHAGNPPRDEQIKSFTRHLELASRLGKPICVHNRESTDDVMTLISRFEGVVVPVLHCFTGDLATARAAIAMGCYISFAGNVTYPRLRDLLGVAAEIPDERLLLETDAPFLAPLSRRGRPNEPACIVETYDAIASARGTSRDALGRLVEVNARHLFGWPAIPVPGEGAAA